MAQRTEHSLAVALQRGVRGAPKHQNLLVSVMLVGLLQKTVFTHKNVALRTLVRALLVHELMLDSSGDSLGFPTMSKLQFGFTLFCVWRPL